nr:hypothetical protein [Prevotella sp.]
MTKVQLGALLREASELDFLFFHFPQEEHDVFFPDTPEILMMLRHNSEIHQIMVGKILHIMSVVLYFPEKGCHLGTNRSDNET